MRKAWLLLLLLLSLSCAQYSGVIMKSCSGWRLNRLPLVKKFIREDSEFYNLEIIYEGGDPRLIFIDETGKEAETVNVSDLDQKGIKKVLEDHGFYPTH
ncbi:unnamed protein product [Blepharisma stoltei]|uniref:Selenoprotein F/M domain-containing protein n=1 Tax=Blepharisma stoltei TaxID=1481888 RepID=A0AAU9IAT6_9CILI|nr:unnamed protein product [Blepharisma stoltei]